jgi:DNA end-binding protein Ku
MRAVTRTTLTLGDLLEIPVGIVAATGSQEVKFDTACEDGAPRVQQFVHPTRRRALLERDEEGELHDVEIPELVEDAIKGVRAGQRFRRIPDVELVAARAETKLDTVELLEFIDYRKVPTDRLAGSFWLQPDPGFEKPLGVLMEAMRRDGRAMVVRYAVRDRQRLGVIRVRKVDGGSALLLNDVAFANTWRAPDEQVLAPSQVEALDERSVAAALRIIEGLSGDGEALSDARDELPDKLRQIVERAHEGIYDDPARVLELASRYRDEDLHERADQLVEWAEARWPELEDKREEVEAVIAEGGDGIGEKLAAIVG